MVASRSLSLLECGGGATSTAACARPIIDQMMPTTIRSKNVAPEPFIMGMYGMIPPCVCVCLFVLLDDGMPKVVHRDGLASVVLNHV